MVLALTANFSAWGGCCARIAASLRRHYDFTDEARASFGFLARPAPELGRGATEAVRAAPDEGTLDHSRAYTYGRLLQDYEAMFWSALTRTA
ncbi:hypothetical protein [Streptomyces sp. H51]|uniref:hypothetical protein n=1 Tax=Streptomyces sp. H51 TaxID=3111770 RepID=UPI003B63A873